MQFQASDYSICNPCGELHGVARSNPATVRRGDVGDTVMTLQDALKKAGEAQITEPWWCPDDPHDPRPGTTHDFVAGEGKDTDRTSVSFLSNDREYLKRQIDNYKLYDGTGTPIALKWGLLLLDPAIQPMLREAAR